MLTARDSIFASQTFRRYFVGQAFSYVGDGLRFIAIPLLVFHLTKSALSLGFTYVLEILPFALAGLIGGSLADRIDRKRLMISCDFVRFCIITAFAVGYWTNTLSLPLLYGGIVVLSICAAFFLGGQSSSIPYMIRSGAKHQSRCGAACRRADLEFHCAATGSRIAGTPRTSGRFRNKRLHLFGFATFATLGSVSGAR